MKDAEAEVLCMAHAHVDKFMAERSFPATEARKAQPELDTLANIMPELNVAATCSGSCALLLEVCGL